MTASATPENYTTLTDVTPDYPGSLLSEQDSSLVCFTRGSPSVNSRLARTITQYLTLATMAVCLGLIVDPSFAAS